MRAGAVHYIHARQSHWAAEFLFKAMIIIAVTGVLMFCAVVPLMVIASAFQFVSDHFKIVVQ